MIQIRRADERGRTKTDWLDSRHTFSFAEYRDPRHMGFRALRVVNDDRVAPGRGFETHFHRDMEIVSYVLDGALAHRDSLGNGSVIRAGDVQRMSAGRGVEHSEFNASADAPVRFLQIWIRPERFGIEPGYEQRAFPAAERLGGLRLVASRDGRDGTVRVHQDAEVHLAALREGDEVRHPLAAGRCAWMQVARGSVRAAGHDIAEGDGLSVAGAPELVVAGRSADAEVLLFDLADRP